MNIDQYNYVKDKIMQVLADSGLEIEMQTLLIRDILQPLESECVRLVKLCKKNK